MGGKQVKTIRVAGRKVQMPLGQYRRIQALLNQGSKIDAVVLIREHARVGVRSAQRALEDAVNFTQPAQVDTKAPPKEHWLVRLRAILSDRDALRLWIAQHPLHIGGLVAGFFVLSTLIVAGAADGPDYDRSDLRVWYQDLSSGELFVAVAQGSPMSAPSDGQNGRSGVRAYMLTCGACDQEQQYVGYLEKYTDRAQSARNAFDESDEIANEQQLWEQLSQGHLIRGGDDERWVRYDSAEGLQIRHEAMGKCKPQYAKPCYPH